MFHQNGQGSIKSVILIWHLLKLAILIWPLHYYILKILTPLVKEDKSKIKWHMLS